MDTIRCFAFILLFQQSLAYFKCPHGSVDDFYRDPDDCTKFHRCYESTRQATFSCPPGTYFDELIVSCDHAYKVKCDTDKYGAGSYPEPLTAKPPTNVLDETDSLLDWRSYQPQSRSQQHRYYNSSRTPQGSDHSKAQYRQSPQSSEMWSPPKSHVVWKPSPTFPSKSDSYSDFQNKQPIQRQIPQDYSRGEAFQSRQSWTTPKSHVIWKPNPTLQSKTDSRSDFQYREPPQRYNPTDYSRGRELQSRTENRYPPVNQPNYGYNQQRPNSQPDLSKQGRTPGYQDGYQQPETGSDYQSRGYAAPHYHYNEPETDRRYQRPYPENSRVTQKPESDGQYQKPDSNLYQQYQTPRPYNQRKDDYDGSDNRYPLSSHTRYGSEDRRPDSDNRRYYNSQHQYPEQQQTTPSYFNRNTPRSDFQDRDSRGDDKQPDGYKYGDPFRVITRSPYNPNEDRYRDGRREPNYGRDWSQRQPSSQTSRPYQHGYDGRQPRREKEFEDWFTTAKPFTNIEPDLSNLQNLSKSNYDTLYQLCLRLYTQDETVGQNYKRGNDPQSLIRQDKQQLCEQFNPSRQQVDGNQLPDLLPNWPKFTTPTPREDRVKTYRKEPFRPDGDTEPSRRKTDSQRQNYGKESYQDWLNQYATTKAPWRVPKYTEYYSRPESDRYQPRQYPQDVNKQNIRDYTNAPYKPPYQYHDSIDSQRKVDENAYHRREDLYASSSNTNPRFPNENRTDDVSNFLPNEDPFAIHNLISNLRCEDTHLKDCEDCETLSYLKFPKVVLKSPIFQSYNLSPQTVEKECFQLCLEKDCIAYSFNNKTGNCSIYLSDVTGQAVSINMDYSTVIVEPKVAILKEEWLITSPAAPTGKPMAVISSGNSIKCLQMCYQIGEQCKAVGYDFNTKICKFYDSFNGKKVALKTNTIAIQHKNISEFDEELLSDPQTRLKHDRQHICVKFNPSRKTQERNQMADLSPRSLKLTENTSERYPAHEATTKISPPSDNLIKEPNRKPYIYTESDPFQHVTESSNSRYQKPDYGHHEPKDDRDSSQRQTSNPTRRPYDRQPRREHEFDEWFPTTKADVKEAKQNNTLYQFCLQLYGQQKTTPTYNRNMDSYQQSVVALDKQQICEQFNPNREQKIRNQIEDRSPHSAKSPTQSPTKEGAGRFETYPKEPFKPMGHESNANLYPFSLTTEKSKPERPENIKTWWSWDDDADKAGRCGVGAPKINGVFPTCNPNSRSSYCCGYTGYCGSGAAFCDCTLCVNFKKTPNFRW